MFLNISSKKVILEKCCLWVLHLLKMVKWFHDWYICTAEPGKSESLLHVIYSPKAVLISNKRCISNIHIHTSIQIWKYFVGEFFVNNSLALDDLELAIDYLNAVFLLKMSVSIIFYQTFCYDSEKSIKMWHKYLLIEYLSWN